MASSSRRRFAGEASELASALAPFATHLRWLEYDESPKLHTAKTIPGKIIQYEAVVGKLYELSSNLSFKDTTVKGALEIIWSNNFKDEPDHFREDWIATMATRLRNLLRATSQGLSASRKPAWAQMLLWFQSGAAVQKQSTESADTSWVYGWSVQLGKAWRQDERGRKELCTDLYAPAGAQPTDSTMAKYNDGTTHQVAELTIEQFGDLTKPRNARTGKYGPENTQ